MRDNQIQQSVQIAQKNWKKWCDVFEHSGSVPDNPLLTNQAKFTSFLAEYSVNRTIRAGTHDKFRRWLAKSPQFLDAILDDTGEGIDKLERNLRRKFGTHDGRNHIIFRIVEGSSLHKARAIRSLGQVCEEGS